MAPLVASSSGEVQPLLSPTTSKVQITHPCHCPPRYLCLPSKAAILILLLASVVGVMYSIGVVAFGLLHVNDSNWNAHISSMNTSLFSFLSYAFYALMMMFYPLSGFIADVCCGRFKTVVVSLIIFTISVLLFSFTCILLKVYAIQLVPPFSHNQILTIICIILLLSALLICLLYTSPSPRDATLSRMPSSA